MTDSGKPRRPLIVRVLGPLVLYPVVWLAEWQNRRLKRKLAKREKRDRADRP